MDPDLETLMSTTYKLNSVNIYMTSLDNNEPASVTALAVSRDHKTVYVGDDRGRVFSWMVSNKPGKGEWLCSATRSKRSYFVKG